MIHLSPLNTSRKSWLRCGASSRTSARYGATNAHSSSETSLGYGFRVAMPACYRFRVEVHNTLYAYAVLESQVRVSTIAQGLDPMIGYLHACRPGRVALVYDLMEPLRPQVDRLVLHFVRLHPFAPSDFVLNSDG